VGLAGFGRVAGGSGGGSRGVREEVDQFQSFVRERYALGQDQRCQISLLRAAYVEWVKENGEGEPLSPRESNERLLGCGCTYGTHRFNGSDPLRAWKGIGLRD